MGVAKAQDVIGLRLGQSQEGPFVTVAQEVLVDAPGTAVHQVDLLAGEFHMEFAGQGTQVGLPSAVTSATVKTYEASPMRRASSSG